MPTRFERELREHLHRNAEEARVFPRALARRIRAGSEPQGGIGIVPQIALACGLLLFAGLLAYGVAAIRGGSPAGVGTRPEPTPPMTGTPGPSASPQPSASPPDLSAFSCTDHAGGAPAAASQLVAIRAAHHPGYDRITFEFVGPLPSYTVARQSSARFVRDASGQPVNLIGVAGLKLTFRGVDLSASVPPGETPSLPVVLELRNIGNFERVVSYGVGLASPACLRVMELSGPTRLVIDVQTPPAAG